MANQNKAIKEKIRLEYKKKYEQECAEIIEKAKKTDSLVLENRDLREKVALYEEEIRKLSDWNKRLIECMDLEPDQLSALKKQLSLAKSVDDIMGMFRGMSAAYGFR